MRAGHRVRVPYTYDFPRPGVTVDVVLATAGPRGELQVLLIERGHDPFAGTWALPGGFVDEHEDLEVAARREMREETHLELGPMVQLGAYGTPHRDPRGHTVGVVFLAVCGPGELEPEAGDDAAECRWFAARRPPRGRGCLKASRVGPSTAGTGAQDSRQDLGSRRGGLVGVSLAGDE